MTQNYANDDACAAAAALQLYWTLLQKNFDIIQSNPENSKHNKKCQKNTKFDPKA